MNQLSSIISKLTTSQKNAYNLICNKKYHRAEGPRINTFRSLAKLGLIKLNPESTFKHDYVLSQEPPKAVKKPKVPLTKDVIKGIIEEVAKTKSATPNAIKKFSRPAADHTNLNREYHVTKWLRESVKATAKRFVTVKCLTMEQMEYIIENQGKTAQAIADHLGKEKYEVLLFFQANAIEPAPPGKPKNYHKPWQPRQQYI